MPMSKKEVLHSLAPESEYDMDFLQGMLDRMTVSFFKYGAVKDGYPSRLDALKSLQQRIEKYQQTGNTEFLVDVANFAMIEFMRPSIPGAHFEATDSDQSSGRTSRSGKISNEKNENLTRW